MTKKRINWITESGAKRAAKHGHKAAANHSILHWTQILDAGPSRFLDAYNKNKVAIHGYMCSICIRYYDHSLFQNKPCQKCPLFGYKHNKNYKRECCPEWRIVMELIWKENFSNNKWNEKTEKAIKAMITRIQKLL